MDLVDGYPKADIAYIGFFMMNLRLQGKQIGTTIISEVIDYLKSIGKKSVRLAIDKGFTPKEKLKPAGQIFG